MARTLKTGSGRALAIGGAGGVLGAALRIGFRVKAMAAAPAGSPVTWFQPFARGDVPPGWRVSLADTAGVAVVVQQDQEVTWPMDGRPGEGSLRGAALSFLTPVALAAAEVASFTLSVVPGLPSRTGHMTLAAMRAATNYRIEMRGLDLGADVLEMGFNETTTTFPEATPAASWGANPVGGWEVIRSGPVCVEWLAWRYTRTVPGGAQHRWQKAQMYVRQWSNGLREITPVLSQPNAYAPHPTGTVGPAYQTRIACQAELFDGVTRLYAWGGPNDLRTFTLPAGAVDAVANELVLGRPVYGMFGYGTPFSLSGALPAGLTTADTFFAYEFGPGTRTKLGTRRSLALKGDLTGVAAFGAAGVAGPVTVMPAALTYPSCAAVLMTAEANPVWQGAVPRPDLLVAHDELYLTRRTRSVPPYDLTVARPEPAPGAGPPFVVGSMTGEMYALDGTGDAVSADRIGYISVTGAATVLLPFDPPRDRASKVLALQWAGYTLFGDDHASGRPVVSNNGRNRAGSVYPGLGACNPGYMMGYVPSGGGATPWGGYQAWFHDQNSIGFPGYFPSYAIPVHGSHLPDFTTVPYLRTGHHLYAMLALNTACAVFAGFYGRNRTIGARTYYGGMFESGRTQGWSLRALGNVECFVPDSHPSRAMIKDALDDCAEWWRDSLPTSPTRFVGAHFDFTSVISWPWMLAIFALSVGMEVWRGTRPAWRDIYESCGKFHVEAFDDMGVSPGAGWLAANYDFSVTSSPGVPYTDIATMNAQYGATPFPATGFRQANATHQDQNSYAAMQAATLAMMETNTIAGLANIPSAGRVRRQQVKRRVTSPLFVLPISGSAPGSYMYPAWAFAPVVPE